MSAMRQAHAARGRKIAVITEITDPPVWSKKRKVIHLFDGPPCEVVSRVVVNLPTKVIRPHWGDQ